MEDDINRYERYCPVVKRAKSLDVDFASKSFHDLLQKRAYLLIKVDDQVQNVVTRESWVLCTNQVVPGAPNHGESIHST